MASEVAVALLLLLFLYYYHLCSPFALEWIAPVNLHCVSKKSM